MPRLAALVTFAFVALAAGICTSAQVKVAHHFRAVTLKTEPAAKVWIDGVFFGQTDEGGRFTIRTISAGNHTIRIRCDGFKEKNQALPASHKGDIAVVLTKTNDQAELAFQEAERLSLRDREEAVEAYQRAIKLRPAFPEAYLAMARVLSDSGDLDAALKAIASARKYRPGYAEAAAVEGRIQKDLDDEPKAIAAFKKAIAEGKGFQPEALTGLGLIFKEKAEGFGLTGDFDQESSNYTEAAKYFRSAITQLSGAPDSIVVYQLLGLIYERQKRYDEAISLYQEFIDLYPDNSEVTAFRSFIEQIKKLQSR